MSLSPLTIGRHSLANNLALAPMAGITERAFRRLCRRWGAGLTVSEMIPSRSMLAGDGEALARADHADEPAPVAVQIAGGEPGLLAEAARWNAARGADLIDINLGCPSKTVCKQAAGSALMRDEALVRRILEAVLAVVDVPVTLKMRTGWDRSHKNAPAIARMAEDLGVAALAVHGRTRADKYKGEAEYETIARVRAAVGLPLWANGDVREPADAARVLGETGADGIMIGRGAQGRPWLFARIERYLAEGRDGGDPPLAVQGGTVLEHLDGIEGLHGGARGARLARKHLAAYAGGLPAGAAAAFRTRVNGAGTVAEQRTAVREFFLQQQWDAA
ncbi:MAG TPA: tRNA dihydrouridine synthase DusB [Gammaproteobacteria bacterium]|nr:tRNA dihydrouridine synthase DusB [Gammaproteobacteria bacterium]